ncbi:cucumisin-like [Phalaenopsis equestris]|uniref:cucumisin-like n=1 Tax=Phalaenopsis equestris TaxID=78828 RepID=UPI0009E5B22F|nr:cucumisin-like [Phalaenopsis equestris]
MIRRYVKSFNGFAAFLTDYEAKTLSGVDGVVSVFLSKERQLHTTRSWDYMGMPTNVHRAALESDIIIGMFDTGIWPENESFQDSGFGPPPSKWKGTTQASASFVYNNFFDKIIGAKYYHHEGDIIDGNGNTPSPRDTDGHGTSTASIAAGRLLPGTSFGGLASGTARGGVPSARLAIYKVCWKGNKCSDFNILAAFDDAIADGVDIISISIGESISKQYFEDAIAIGSFHAMKKDILTSCSAGNSGPSRSTLSNYAPWMLTVAAGTIDRKFVANVKLGDGQVHEGMAVNMVGLDDVMYPLVEGRNAPNLTAGISGARSAYCNNGALNADVVRGKIVICSGVTSDGSELTRVQAAGAIMNSYYPVNSAYQFSVPSSVLGAHPMFAIHKYLKSTSTVPCNYSQPTASISKTQAIFDGAPPIAASFSSRGPNRITPNILKPDITAPGINILSATSGKSTSLAVGTSAACPHVSAAAAYVKSFKPNWSPAAIKSALMTTAKTMSSDKTPEAEFAYGAGYLNPLAALNPGLVYDAEEKDYVNMLCSQGYNTERLKLVTGDDSSCTSANNSTELNLNYPSFALSVSSNEKPFSASFLRTLTNVEDDGSTYKASVIEPSGQINVSVEPNVLTFEKMMEKKSFVLKVEGAAVRSVISAALVWSNGVRNVRSPIVVFLY